MLALLLDHGIQSAKRPLKDGLVRLDVESARIPAAVALLSRHGYPKQTFSVFGDLFSSDRLISTPYEDHARFTYGLSQELASTFSGVDGVMTARVHLVMPSADDDPVGASATVFIKHNPDYRMSDHVAKFKTVVSSAVEALSYDDVNVALFPAEPVHRLSVERPPMRFVFGVGLSADSVNRFYVLVGALGGLLGVSLLGHLYWVFSRPRGA